jgi:ankyrin repeat protein
LQTRAGLTALHLAAMHGYAAKCKLLLAGDGLRALHLQAADGLLPAWGAVEQGHLAALKVLDEYGAHLHERRAFGDTMLHYAVGGPADESHIAVLEYLLSKGVAPNAANFSGMTPLHMAVNKSCLEAVRLLLQHGADPSIRNAEGANALHLAAQQTAQGVAVLQCILRSNRVAAGSAITGIRTTALQIAAKSCSAAAVRLLLKHGAAAGITRKQRDAIVLGAVVRGHADVVEALLTNGRAEVAVCANAVFDHGMSLLVHAVRSGYVDVARLLLDLGANVNAVDRLGRSVLFAAASLSSSSTSSSSSSSSSSSANSSSSSSSTTSSSSSSSTTSSSSSSSADMITLLLERGADVHAHTEAWQSPLLAAVQAGNVQCAQALIDAGADVNQMCLTAVPGCSNIAEAVDAELEQMMTAQVAIAERTQALAAKYSTAAHSDKLQPLLMAASTPAVVKLLLAAGASVHATTAAGGRTCLHVAAAAGYPAAVLCLLIKAGVDISAVDSEGETAAELAHAAGHTLAESLLNRAARDSESHAFECRTLCLQLLMR